MLVLPAHKGFSSLLTVRLSRPRQTGVLERHGVELIGAKLNAIQMAEDRQLFKEAMGRLGLKTPQSGTACTCVACQPHATPTPCLTLPRVVCLPRCRLEQGIAVSELIGSYPLIIRPAFTLGGSGGGIAYNRQEFEAIVASGIQASAVNQVLIERSLLGWKEYEVRPPRLVCRPLPRVLSVVRGAPPPSHTAGGDARPGGQRGHCVLHREH